MLCGKLSQCDKRIRREIFLQQWFLLCWNCLYRIKLGRLLPCVMRSDFNIWSRQSGRLRCCRWAGLCWLLGTVEGELLHLFNPKSSDLHWVWGIHVQMNKRSIVFCFPCWKSCITFGFLFPVKDVLEIQRWTTELFILEEMVLPFLSITAPLVTDVCHFRENWVKAFKNFLLWGEAAFHLPTQYFWTQSLKTEAYPNSS